MLERSADASSHESLRCSHAESRGDLTVIERYSIVPELAVAEKGCPIRLGPCFSCCGQTEVGEASSCCSVDGRIIDPGGQLRPPTRKRKTPSVQTAVSYHVCTLAHATESASQG